MGPDTPPAAPRRPRSGRAASAALLDQSAQRDLPGALELGLAGLHRHDVGSGTRSRLPLPQQAVAAWFGPKGFASVVYGLLILEAGVARADEMFHLIALVIFASILAHSSTDVPIAHAFARAEAQRSRSGGGATQDLTPQSDGASGDSQP